MPLPPTRGHHVEVPSRPSPALQAMERQVRELRTKGLILTALRRIKTELPPGTRLTLVAQGMDPGQPLSVRLFGAEDAADLVRTLQRHAANQVGQR